MPRVRSIIQTLALLAPLTLMCGCEPQAEVVRFRPMLAGAPGAISGGDVTVNASAVTSQTRGDQKPTVIERDDGSVVLLTHSIAHLMGHLRRTMANGEYELIHEQLLAEATKEHFRSKGRDPYAALQEFFADHQRDLMVLMAQMPMAERSASVMMERTAPRQYVLRLQAAYTEDSDGKRLRLTKFWVALERGQYKFLWAS